LLLLTSKITLPFITLARTVQQKDIAKVRSGPLKLHFLPQIASDYLISTPKFSVGLFVVVTIEAAMFRWQQKAAACVNCRQMKVGCTHGLLHFTLNARETVKM